MKKTLAMMSAVIVLLVMASPAFSGRVTGLGSNFSTLTGIDAVRTNPAALGETDRVFRMQSAFQGGIISNLPLNAHLDGRLKERVLDGIRNDGLLFDVGGGGELLIGIGPAVGQAGFRGDMEVALSPDLGEIGLEGNEIGRTYVLDGTRGEGALYGDLGLSLFWSLPEDYLEQVNDSAFSAEKVYLGAGIHYLQGAIFGWELAGDLLIDHGDQGDDPVFTVEDGEMTLTYTDENSPLATGFAWDLGIYADLGDRYSVGLGVMNLGTLTSSDGLIQHYEFEFDSRDPDEVDDDLLGEPDESREEISWRLPRRIHAGGQMDYSESLRLFLGYTNTSGLKTEHRLAVAAEGDWLRFLPLRLGANYSTYRGSFDFSAGTGLHLGPLRADIGVQGLSGLYYRSRGYDAGVSVGLEF